MSLVADIYIELDGQELMRIIVDPDAGRVETVNSCGKVDRSENYVISSYLESSRNDILEHWERSVANSSGGREGTEQGLEDFFEYIAGECAEALTGGTCDEETKLDFSLYIADEYVSETESWEIDPYTGEGYPVWEQQPERELLYQSELHGKVNRNTVRWWR